VWCQPEPLSFSAGISPPSRRQSPPLRSLSVSPLCQPTEGAPLPPAAKSGPCFPFPPLRPSAHSPPRNSEWTATVSSFPSLYLFFLLDKYTSPCKIHSKKLKNKMTDASVCAVRRHHAGVSCRTSFSCYCQTLYCVCSGAGGLALGVIGTHLVPRRLETGASGQYNPLRILLIQ
jgi:hypothetical protein